MAARPYHRIPAVARHIVAAAEQLMDRADLERQVVKAALADTGVEQEQVVMVVGQGPAREVAAPGIGIGQLRLTHIGSE